MNSPVKTWRASLRAVLTAERQVRPFHCGSQAGDWFHRNCYRCARSNRPDGAALQSACEIENALDAAWVGDGTISREIGRRAGFIGNERALTFDCLERELRE